MVGRTKRRTSREKKIWRRNTASILEGERRKQEKREKGIIRIIVAILTGSNDVVDFCGLVVLGFFFSDAKYNYLLKILAIECILFLIVL